MGLRQENMNMQLSTCGRRSLGRCTQREGLGHSHRWARCKQRSSVRVTTAYGEDAGLNGYYISVSLLLAGDIATNPGPGTETINPNERLQFTSTPVRNVQDQ